MFRKIAFGLSAILSFQPVEVSAQAATKDPECVGNCGEDLNFCNRAAEGLMESCKEECPAILLGCNTDCERIYEDSIETCLSENKDCIDSCPDRGDRSKSLRTAPEALPGCNKSVGSDCSDGCSAQCESDNADEWAKCTEACINDCLINDPPIVPEPPPPSPAN